MDWLEMANRIFEVCIIPLLGILTTYLVSYIKKKSEQVIAEKNNALFTKYVTMLTDTITDCVVSTNQTYVNNLKGKNAFDEAAQKEAFNLTVNNIMAILSTEAKEYLSNAVGDLQTYITAKVEKEVNWSKITQLPIIEETK